ncbi:Nup53/35/40-type RNA recognition motif-domain-containing protein [Halteromyces radiatus]|uniref:Nup53/35/40-type RNA recognition motif-domain-containing protein n=1 Tax=Halteromyces radiatus TaxID=101107 RepID=UPI0022210F22|nr:Nup53/35/40-type RNA recognition motif-domain-containing protein [Halteromyces radiatus]KAI8097074.1 Nup53/35/40-type RNA recognition motif-domain-containing protein [Halteromyces radiatus]
MPVNFDLKKDMNIISSMKDQNIKVGASTTVSIFGFPPDMTADVLEHFTKCGEIAERHQSPGNWMTIRYATQEGARKALECNGTILGNKYMVGVTLLIPATENNQKNGNASIESSSGQPGIVNLTQPIQSVFKTDHHKPSGFLSSFTSTPSTLPSTLPPSSSLSASLSPSYGQSNVMGQQVTKVADNSVMNKLKEIIFGW